MKVITSKQAQNVFGRFLDAAQHEAVVVTRRNKPVGVMLPMDSVSAILDLAESMKKTIEAGVQAGLDDSKAGRGRALTETYKSELTQELKERIYAKYT